jgi:hypothetical protein
MATGSGKEEIALPIIAIGALIAASSPLILVYQAVVWLRFGGWPEISLAFVWYWLKWPWPETDWAGVEKTIIWVFDCPLSGVAIVTGIILIWIGAKLNG